VDFETFAKKFVPPGWVEPIRNVAFLPGWNELDIHNMVKGTHKWESWYLEEAWKAFVREELQ
jgi:hypothetical protein